MRSRLRSVVVAPRNLALGVAAVAIIAVVAPVHVAMAEAVCDDDPELAEAAAELVLSGEPLTPARLREAVRAAGNDAVLVHGVRLHDDVARREREWLQTTMAERTVPFACGRAVGAGVAVVLAAERPGRLERDPTHDLRFRVVLAKGFSHPELVVRGASGEFVRVSVPRSGAWVTVPDDVDPPFVVQLVGEDSTGPRPLAERNVGEPHAFVAATERGGSADASDDAPRVEDNRAGVMTWLAKTRGEEGLRGVRPNQLLDAVARKHAEEVCRAKRAAHRLEDGDPEARLRAAGIEARSVGEAVARAGSVQAALVSLAASPSHAAALLDPRFTDVGAGVALDGGTRCVTVLLAAWPRAIPRSPSKP
ncbi:MAG: CAP domain-containing protein [Polyangiales bacterium]|nr:CAP domain-containing protein [Myxococcales bacterium]